VSARAPCYRGHPLPLAVTDVWEGSSFLVWPPLADGHRDEAPQGRFTQGDCQPATARSRSHGSVFRKDAPLHGSTLVVATGHRWPLRRPFEGATKPGHRDTHAVAAVGLVPTVAKCHARVPQDTRAAEVDALVSTPLRPGRSGPGSGRLLSRCALPSGRGRDLECVDPLRVGRERISSCHRKVMRGFIRFDCLSGQWVLGLFGAH